MIYPARGSGGGLAGAAGRIRIDDGPDLPGKGEFRMEPGETMIVETPGGGGHGDPKTRPRHMLEADLKDGMISSEAAERFYGHRAGRTDE